MKITDQSRLCARLLDVIEKVILPKTQLGVNEGNKAFGAAILRKSDLSLVISRANEETKNPLFHGEISTLNAFYNIPVSIRPNTDECYFLSTHESCPLCLSAITWTGFDNFYYLFGYEETRDAFQIPHNLKILHEVFKIRDGNYSHQNTFWESHDLKILASNESAKNRKIFDQQIRRIKENYVELSNVYQCSKTNNTIPLK